MTNEISQYSAWFSIGEILVDESKQDITAEQAVEKIREIMRSMQKPQEVVGCKDCLVYDSHNHRCKYFNHGVQAESDYCSHAERREDGRNVFC